MMRKRIQGFLRVGLIAGLVFAIGGCASSGGGEATHEKAPAKKVAAKSAVPVPANSKLAKIDIGMSEQDVRKVLGEPSHVRVYPTSKAWIPFYFGGDTMRSDWSYSKVGKVVLKKSESMVAFDDGGRAPAQYRRALIRGIIRRTGSWT